MAEWILSLIPEILGGLAVALIVFILKAVRGKPPKTQVERRPTSLAKQEPSELSGSKTGIELFIDDDNIVIKRQRPGGRN